MLNLLIYFVKFVKESKSRHTTCFEMWVSAIPTTEIRSPP